MENLSPTQIEHFEDLLAHSTTGVHAMYDNQTLAEILKKPVEDDFFNSENMTRANQLFERFLEHETLESRRVFLDNLESNERELLIHTYFHLVESTVRQISDQNH